MSGSFEGVFAALTTPFVNDGVAVEEFKKNILRYNTTSLAGYVVLGSTGEAVFLGDDEAETLLGAARAAAASGKKIIAGASRESTRSTVEFVHRLAGLGADAALLKPPHYYKAAMNQDTLKRYFFEVADGAPIPVIIYNIPQNTGVPVEPPTIIELAGHPNIAGIKDSSGRLANLSEVIASVRPEFSFLLGAGGIFLAGLLLGASGGILALAAVVPDLCVEIHSLFRRGRLVDARKLQLDLVPLNKALTETLGIPAIKYALDLLGYSGGPPRAPLRPLDEAGKAHVRQLLKIRGLLKNPADIPS
ncbi:MAG: dihydrodipicolinate synthase family protein [Candidatus Aminicenantes bacterium]|nr:dihydrodipicolinate synthase family protein [Candidatus Aminicenantes bacterium]